MNTSIWRIKGVGWRYVMNDGRREPFPLTFLLIARFRTAGAGSFSKEVLAAPSASGKVP